MYIPERWIQKVLLHKFHIQFRKTDARRSENAVLNINRDCTKQQKKVLVCYLDYGRASYALSHGQEHTNSQEMCQIIRVLIELDCCIDVCDCSNPEAIGEIAENYYDYIFGLGDMFRYAGEHNPHAHAILYMTENPYDVSYQKEMERIAYFKERTGRTIPLCRSGVYYKQGDEQRADAIVCVGETTYFAKNSKRVIRVMPSAFKNPFTENDFSKRKQTHFLVLGVHGFVHKGNDLLIETFRKHSDWKLYLCGTNIDKECAALGYKRTDNIIDCGFVNTASEQFAKLLQTCTYVLLPSCSEGMSTGLMTCMMHGLIPITMRGTGMDECSRYCMFFEDYRLASIEEKLKEAVSQPKEALEQLSRQIYEYANREFTLEQYTQRMRRALGELIE